MNLLSSFASILSYVEHEPVVTHTDSGRPVTLWGILWIICFILWALTYFGAAYDPADRRYRYGSSILLIPTIGILGFLFFFH
jgi:hypothetical protein